MFNPWTDDRVARLRELDAEGLSSSQIADELGNGISRNAVIGKRMRLGMKKHEHTGGKQGRPRRESQTPIKRRVVRIIAGGHGELRISETIEQDLPMSRLCADDIPLTQRKQLLDLNSNDCRFPYGDPGKPDFFFCGAPADCQPYCWMHTRIATAR